MTLTLDIDFAQVLAHVRALERTARVETPAIMATEVRTDTLLRMSIGVDESGRKHKDYSDAHAATRRKKGLQTGYVDHRMTGGLQDGYRFDKSRRMLTVPPHMKGQAHGTNRLRSWSAPSKESLRDGAILVAERLDRVRA